ncbi:MAG TPA: hypothetical protein VNZ94_00510 [Xanthobacteraceae bacterium]|nr:hypothetical protein [Xanthobacteraceae bacterium]
MAIFTFFHEFKRFMGEAAVDLTNHTFKAMLTNVAPDALNDVVKADITEIPAGNGYIAGGMTLTSVTWSETGPDLGVWRFDANDFTWNAVGGDIAPFRYVVFYDDTTATPAKPLIGFIDYTTSLIVSNGNGFTVDIGIPGIFELQ